MGYIGLGNRGDQVHDAFLEHGDQQTVAVCDLREDYLDLAVKKSRATPKRYKEYRKLLEDKDVDAVVIATPDHWHAIMFVEACHAGKDVYVEKPLSLTVYEGRKMVETAERTRRVVQVGTNRRSWKSYFEAAGYIRSRGLGRVSVARCFHIRNEWPLGLSKPPDGPPPSAGAAPESKTTARSRTPSRCSGTLPGPHWWSSASTTATRRRATPATPRSRKWRPSRSAISRPATPAARATATRSRPAASATPTS
jgi:hypothetical protein